MRRLLIIFFLVVCAIAERPNILFIMSDDQWRREFNFLAEGQDEGKSRNLTPTIDRLAHEGVILDRMYASSTVCTPSRYSVLTGEYPARSNGRGFLQDMAKYGNQPNPHFQAHIEPGKANIGSVLRAHGYLTGFAGKNHVLDDSELKGVKVDKKLRQADPFDPWTQATLARKQAIELQAVRNNGFDFAGSIYAGNVPGHMPIKMEAHNQDWITKAGLDFLALADKQDKPFYLHFCTTLNHGPGPAGHKYTGDPRFTAAGVLEAPLTVQPTRASIAARLKAAGHAPKSDHADALWLDDGIAAILAKLEAMGELDNTVIFYFNDNGMQAKGALYEGGALTPAFVWGPKLKGSRRVTQLLANIDFAPTIYELCGIPSDAQPTMDGKSFLPLLRGDDVVIHDAIHLQIGSTRAVIKDGFKYLAWRIHPNREATFDIPDSGKPAPLYHIASTRGGRGLEKKIPQRYPAYWNRDQLYDLTRDPDEQTNLADNPEYAPVLATLKNELRRQLADQPGTFAEFKTVN
jgi:arylsulfatase A-like enzyme